MRKIGRKLRRISQNNIFIPEQKRRSYQEATEGEWEKAIIDRIVEQDSSKLANLNRNQPARKSIKDLIRNKLNLDSNSAKNSGNKAHYARAKELLEAHEKERKKLEEKFCYGNEQQRMQFKNMIKMEEAQIKRLKKEISDSKGKIDHQSLQTTPPNNNP